MTRPKRAGVLSERERAYLGGDGSHMRNIERIVLLAAARRMARTHLSEYGTADCTAIAALRSWAKEIPR